jgi:hypothetical protein
MKKIVINQCFGGFRLSVEGLKMYNDISGKNITYSMVIQRDDPFLVTVVESLKERANGKYTKLNIVEIPDNVDWTIEEYDGAEWIAEKHRTWGK